MTPRSLIPASEFARIRRLPLARDERLGLLADMCRLNTLGAVKWAGSGHLGTSFSAMDIVVWLYEEHLNTVRLGCSHPDRDIYFSSKGHDVPGLYAVLFSHGIIPTERFRKLRRLGGLDGHPDVRIPGIEANSGSLGMGISKGRGMAWAKRRSGRGGRVYVMTGDGELQEGQNYEAFQAAAHQRVANLTVIVDHNTVQSDQPVVQILDLGDLEAKVRTFGWFVARCDGHDVRQLDQAMRGCLAAQDRPQMIIADTIKGKGVSFMEHPAALEAGGGYYRWHAGAPDDASFAAAWRELSERIEGRLQAAGAAPLKLEDVAPEVTPASGAANSLAGEPVSKAASAGSGAGDEYVVEAYGRALVELGRSRSDLLVLDADLEADCRLRAFRAAFPERFIENGIAEQDMVSMAGGLARQGFLPVVNSFANFLAARANEQIYNNATEGTKILYVCHYAGLIPAGPGKSHQSIRDISLLGALPNVTIVQPCNGQETRALLEYCVETAAGPCAIRLNIGPSPRVIALPDAYRPAPGRGVVLAEGTDIVVIGYGPVLLHEVLCARQLLAQRQVSVKVVNMPWLNRVEDGWLEELVGDCQALAIVEDHAPVGGLGDRILGRLSARGLAGSLRCQVIGVEGFPACGTPAEALRAHRLDGASLADRLQQLWDGARPSDVRTGALQR